MASEGSGAGEHAGGGPLSPPAAHTPAPGAAPALARSPLAQSPPRSSFVWASLRAVSSLHTSFVLRRRRPSVGLSGTGRPASASAAVSRATASGSVAEHAAAAVPSPATRRVTRAPLPPPPPPPPPTPPHAAAAPSTALVVHPRGEPRCERCVAGQHGHRVVRALLAIVAQDADRSRALARRLRARCQVLHDRATGAEAALARARARDQQVRGEARGCGSPRCYASLVCDVCRLPAAVRCVARNQALGRMIADQRRRDALKQERQLFTAERKLKARRPALAHTSDAREVGPPV